MQPSGLHPDLVATVFRAAPGRVALITDAMAAAGASDGDFALGSLRVAVRDGLAVLKGTDTIAGSTLTQDKALKLAVERAGVAPVHAVEALTITPARALGLHHRHGLLARGSRPVMSSARWFRPDRRKDDLGIRAAGPTRASTPPR